MATTRPILSIGSGIDTPHLRGAVRLLQILLQRAGFLSANAIVDGLFGQGTQSAVIKFQRSKNFFADGIVGEETWLALENNSAKPSQKRPILRQGDGVNNSQLRGAVRVLQFLLQRAGYLPKNFQVNGIFDKQTETAVINFQRVKNLLINGIVDLETWLALEGKTPEKHSKYPILRRGDGIEFPNLKDAVKELQTLLRLQADGLFGKYTEAGVKNFQRNKNLFIDGVAGGQTWSNLLNKPTRTRR
ncbi:MAG: peptidoglycan-binding protein [Moorea sp. SIO2B7]|nr:peptidoglycan-binding protein [Moorena sp. SIO2B7]